jgi:hypothetical protein
MKRTLCFVTVLLLLAGCAGTNNNGTDDTDTSESRQTEDLSIIEPPAKDGFNFEYAVTNEWDTGFEADVKIINNTDVAVDGWKLSFRGDFTITKAKNAKLIIFESPEHMVANEFWTKAINPYSAVVFSFSADKGQGVEVIIDGFALYENDIPDEPIFSAEMTVSDLIGFSELGYNVLLWVLDDATEVYTVYRSAGGGDFEEIASVENANFYLDHDVEENAVYEYYIVQTLDDLSEESGKISVTATLAEPKGVSAEECIGSLRNDCRATGITYQDGNSLRYVSNDITLADSAENGSSVIWLSDREQIISPRGEVTRPTGGFFPVVLTAVCQNGDYVMKKLFPVSVAPLNNAIQKEMTLEDLKELNNGKLPEITYNDDGTIRQISYRTREDNISPFSVYSDEDALALIYNNVRIP